MKFKKFINEANTVTTQMIIGILKKAGKKAQKYEKGIGKVQSGYNLVKVRPGTIGVLVNSNDDNLINEYIKILEDAGLKVHRVPNTAKDALFVKI